MLIALWLIAAMPFVDEACAESFGCQDVIYKLVYEGQVIPTPDMDLAECEAFKAQVEEQTKAFSSLECRATVVEREQS